MLRRLLFIVVLSLGLPMFGQKQKQTGGDEELLHQAQSWAEENLDPAFLKSLQGTDEAKLKEFLAQVQKQFQADYVLDLPAIKDTIEAFLPFLEEYEETEPYAIWLKARLDYFDVSEQLRRTQPALKPGQKIESAKPATERLQEIWIRKVVERPWPEQAKPYVSQLKPVFASEKVPPELVWIAEVESSFDPRAKSPVGAAGLFQLMPATAQRYGLRTTWPLDQRYKPEPSARAAARYLQYLYSRYKDWRLALAAYNAGEGRVDALLAKRKADRYEEIASGLPSETQMYVPKLEATLLRREGLKLSQLRVPQQPARPANAG